VTLAASISCSGFKPAEQLELQALGSTVRRHQAALNGVRGTKLDAEWLRTVMADTTRITSSLQAIRESITSTDDPSLERDFRILGRDLACLENRVKCYVSRIQRRDLEKAPSFSCSSSSFPAPTPALSSSSSCSISSGSGVPRPSSAVPAVLRAADAKNRRQSITHPVRPPPSNILSPISSYSPFPTSVCEDLVRLRIPVFILESLPKEILGRGVEANVYSVQAQEREFALKLRHPMTWICDAQGYRKFSRPKYHPVADLMVIWRMLRQLPVHPRIPKFEGLVYIKEIDAWGILYEKIAGKELDIKELQAMSLDKRGPYVMKIMTHIAQALQTLDNAGYSHYDVAPRNVMIRPDGTAVLVDHAKDRPCNTADDFAGTKMQFSVLCMRALIGETPAFEHGSSVHRRVGLVEAPLLAAGIPSQLIELLLACYVASSGNIAKTPNWDCIIKTFAKFSR